MTDIEKKECAIEMIRLTNLSSFTLKNTLDFIRDANLLNDKDYNRELRKLKLEKLKNVKTE